MEQKTSSFADLTPFERQIFIAEIYHNAWYSQERFEMIYDLFHQWTANPVKEKKFMMEPNEITEILTNKIS